MHRSMKSVKPLILFNNKRNILMAHLIESMAYVGDTPWHGLGNELSPKQPLEVWAKQAGLDWRIESSDVSNMANNDKGHNLILLFAEQKVLYRYDNIEPLYDVSQRSNT